MPATRKGWLVILDPPPLTGLRHHPAWAPSDVRRPTDADGWLEAYWMYDTLEQAYEDGIEDGEALAWARVDASGDVEILNPDDTVVEQYTAEQMFASHAIKLPT